MGRLTKKKIDQIGKLRAEGYTQIETAEKVGACLKTVRKYDPGSISGSAREWKELQSLPGRVNELEKAIKALTALALSYQVEKLAKEDKYWAWCPKCDQPVTVEERTDKKTRKTYYGCYECGTPIPDAKYFFEAGAYVVSEEKEGSSKQGKK